MSMERSFGRWVRQRRTALDLTQEQLAQQVGCATVTLRQIETGRRRPSQHLAERLADYLQLTGDERTAFVRLARSSMRMAPQTTPSNLPSPLTPLIGREQEMEAVRERLLRPEVRLLTIVGPPGVGKTRLSIQVAVQLQADFADGVWFVALALVRGPDLVLPTIAHTVGVREGSRQSRSETLHAYLRDKQILFLLDNVEHLVAAAPQLAALLAGAPALKLLVTSRTPLHLAGEHQFPVAPLAVPQPQYRLSREHVQASAAVQLFCARAHAVRPDFALTDANAAAVAAICQRLDGLPLALELAAARVKLFSPQILLARLDSRLRVLTGGAIDQDRRHQTLRNTLDWSYHLLTEAEQRLFRRGGVFVGGWTLEAAEAVCNPDGALGVDLLEGLAALLDHSLLQRMEGEAETERFTMLETIHEYARDQLHASGEAELTQCAHAAYYLALAEQAEPELTGPQQGVWLARLDMEHANLRAVLHWAEERGEAELMLRLSGVLWRFWLYRGYMSEGRQWLAVALARGRGGPTALQAKALRVASGLAVGQGDYVQARALSAESLALFRDLGDKAGIAASLHDLGIVARHQEDYGQARALHEESLALSRDLGDKRSIAASLRNLGLVARRQEDYGQARALFVESLALSRDLGDKMGIAGSLLNLGIVALYQGDYRQARALFAESLVLFRDLGHKVGIGNSLRNLGIVALYQGDYRQARALFAESLVLFQNLGHKVGIAEDLERLAAVAAVEGQAARAARLFGTAEALRETIAIPLPPIERREQEQAVATARAQLDEAAFAAAWAEGRTISLEEAVAYALAEDTESRAVGEQ